MTEPIKKETNPNSPLGENNILMDLTDNINAYKNNINAYKNNINADISESPTFTYSSQLLKEVVDNTNKKIPDKSINLIDDFKAIFPLSVTIVFLLLILILIYISFF
jgi:hypothetical protein